MRAQQGRSTAVIEAVASAEGIEPVELAEPLFRVINPDALDVLFRADTGHVTFQYHGYEVTVSEDSAVDVEPLASD